MACNGWRETHSATTRPCAQVMYCHGLAPHGALPTQELNLAFVAARFSSSSAAAAGSAVNIAVSL